MACPTCDHTMQAFSHPDVVWWCPRCGTIKFAGRDHTETTKLVNCLRAPATNLRTIAECISLPDKRDKALNLLKQVRE